MKLAENIQRLRKAAGWTQEQLAQKCAVSRQAVSKWEAGQSVPSLDKLRQLANSFGISVDELVQDDPEPNRLHWSSWIRRAKPGRAAMAGLRQPSYA